VEGGGDDGVEKVAGRVRLVRRVMESEVKCEFKGTRRLLWSESAQKLLYS